mgnify:CR=1 FL=1
MSTIAWDGVSVVADGQASAAGIITDLDIRKIRVESALVYALVGVSPLFDRLIAWYLAGADPDKAPKPLKEDGWGLVVFGARADGSVMQFTDECPYGDAFQPPWAWGSGRLIALGAMYAGCSAEEAVRIAVERDVNTGGEIQMINIAEALGALREAAE